MIYDFKRPPYKRVISLKILRPNSLTPGYEDVQDFHVYKIATTTFIVNGGDGFKFDKEVLESKKSDGMY